MLSTFARDMLGGMSEDEFYEYDKMFEFFGVMRNSQFIYY